MNEKEKQNMDELSQKLEAIDQQEVQTHPTTGTRRWFFRALTFGIGGAILGSSKMVFGTSSPHDVCPSNSYLVEPKYCEGAHDTCTGDNTCVSGNVCQQSNTCTGTNKCEDGDKCSGGNVCNRNTSGCTATENECNENTCGYNSCNSNECVEEDICSLENYCSKNTCDKSNLCWEANDESASSCHGEDTCTDSCGWYNNNIYWYYLWH